MTRDIRPSNLAKEFGLTDSQARQLRKDVEFGRISPPVRCLIVSFDAPGGQVEDAEEINRHLKCDRD